MPLLSSFLLIQTAAVGLIGIAALLVISPATVLSSPTLTLLGSSMHIRQATFIPLPPVPPANGRSVNPLASLTRSTKTVLTTSEHELLALIAIILAAAGFSTMILSSPLQFSKSTLTARTTPEGKTVRKSSVEVGETIAKLNLTQTTWQIFSGLHVIVSAVFVSWMYIFQSEKYGRSIFTASAWSPAGEAQTSSLLANNVTFTLGMVDMLFWGYLYTTVKEERRSVLEVAQRRREEDEEDQANQPL